MTTLDHNDIESIDEDRLHYVVAADELNDGERAIIEVKGRDVAVFDLDGEYRAVGDHCPHMGGPCAEGLVSGTFTADVDGELTYDESQKIISCPWHGWEFDLETGDHLAGTKKRLLTYDVVQHEGDLYVVV